MNAKLAVRQEEAPASRKTSREKNGDMLAHALAGTLELALNAKDAHWNVKGPNFIALHGLFDTLHAALIVHMDDLAERIVQLDGHADASLLGSHERSTLPNYPYGKRRAAEQIGALSSQLISLNVLVRQGIGMSAKAGDEVTADLLTEISRSLDKQRWFLEAHLA
jgi:starvation-inducible DNA-binding protein